VVGTLEYMAPEQARGDAAVDHRADVFALGAMLQQIGAGTTPIVAIAAKAQASEPVARYQTVAAMAADLNRFLAGRAVEAHRERLADWVARLVGRYRLPILLVLTYLVVRALMLWLFRI
jgi:serine/threonine protein kinase